MNLLEKLRDFEKNNWWSKGVRANEERWIQERLDAQDRFENTYPDKLENLIGMDKNLMLDEAQRQALMRALQSGNMMAPPQAPLPPQAPPVGGYTQPMGSGLSEVMQEQAMQRLRQATPDEIMEIQKLMSGQEAPWAGSNRLLETAPKMPYGLPYPVQR